MARRNRQPVPATPDAPRPPRPPIYSRLWHLDADQRRHHGHRRWDPAIVERLVELAATRERVYPPDWSDPRCLRFRASGEQEPLAEVVTADADHLVLRLHGRAAADLAGKLGLACRACSGAGGEPVTEVDLIDAAQVASGPLRELFLSCLDGAGRAARAG